MKQLFERVCSYWVCYEYETPFRICGSCDTIFITNRKTQRYCCDKCRRKGE